jgi:hypothetical protein
MSPESPQAPGPSPAAPSLRRWSYRMVGLIAVQFAIGMWVNLFGSFPANATTYGAVFLYQGDPPLLVHLTLAALLLGGALVTAALASSRSIPGAAQLLIAIGVLAILAAAVSGYLFLASGFANDTDSYAMAVAGVIALLGYALAIAELPRPIPARSP